MFGFPGFAILQTLFFSVLPHSMKFSSALAETAPKTELKKRLFSSARKKSREVRAATAATKSCFLISKLRVVIHVATAVSNECPPPLCTQSAHPEWDWEMHWNWTLNSVRFCELCQQSNILHSKRDCITYERWFQNFNSQLSKSASLWCCRRAKFACWRWKTLTWRERLVMLKVL